MSIHKQHFLEQKRVENQKKLEYKKTRVYAPKSLLMLSKNTSSVLFVMFVNGLAIKTTQKVPFQHVCLSKFFIYFENAYFYFSIDGKRFFRLQGVQCLVPTQERKGHQAKYFFSQNCFRFLVKPTRDVAFCCQQNKERKNLIYRKAWKAFLINSVLTYKLIYI